MKNTLPLPTDFWEMERDSPRSQEDRPGQPRRKRKVRPKAGVGEMGIPLRHLHLRASCRRPLLKACREAGSLSGRGLSGPGGPASLGAPGPACGSASLTPGLSWEAESRRASLERFRVAMTSGLVPEINVPQTRQCGQGLRTYCKYQPGLPIFVPVTLWGAGPGQPLPCAPPRRTQGGPRPGQSLSSCPGCA